MTDEEFRIRSLELKVIEVKTLARIATALEAIAPPKSDVVGTRHQSDVGDLITPSLADLARLEREAKARDLLAL